jgi:type IV pilus assembly protein PilA
MKNGFTLIELLAVIFLLSLILIIVMPVMNDTINKSKTNLSDEQITEIEFAAKQWGLDNLSLTDGSPNYNYVTIKELQNSGYLDDKSIISTKTKEEIPYDTKVCITYDDNQYIYEFKGDC